MSLANPRAARLVVGLYGLVSLFIPLLSQARTWYVRAGSINGNGSYESPFGAIQQGADVAVRGDTVLVYAGTYHESVRPMHAGGAGVGGIIQYIYFLAAGDGPAVIQALSNFCFVLDRNRSYIWIEGFQLTGAYGTTVVHGAAIRTFSDYAVFINNNMYDNDVGVFCEGNGSYEEYNNNRGNYIAHNIIRDSREAGIRLKHSSENDVVFNLLYHNNLAEPCGAVTYYCGINNRIINNTFWDNAGMAVAVYNGTNSDSCIACSNSEVRDNIFARPDSGLLLQVQEKTALDSTSAYHHNLFWGPDSAAPLVQWGSDEFGQGGYLWTLNEFKANAGLLNPLDSVGNFFADPLFVDTAAHDFELLAGSPALNAGSLPADQAPYRQSVSTPLPFPPDNVYASQLTVLQSQLLDQGMVDLGYHFVPGQSGVSPIVVEQWQLNVYPNPYSGKGTLAFILPEAQYLHPIHGEIFDLQGRSIQKFDLPDSPLHVYNLSWDTRTLSCGSYFLVLKMDGKVLRQRIALIK